MPDYRIQIVHHGSHVMYAAGTYTRKDDARKGLATVARQTYPGATVKAAGSKDAVLIVQGGAVRATVSVELAAKAVLDPERALPSTAPKVEV